MALKYNWRKKRWENVKNWDYPGPRYVQCWRETLPKWERDFCAIVGQVPWRKVVQIQSTYQDPKILEWKDSAVKETFEKAKARYWSKINGQPCDTPLPDADLFVDNEIDWNPSIDPQLLLELEEARNSSTNVEDKNTNEDEPYPIFDLNGYLNIKATGWGSIEEEEEQTQAKVTNLPIAGSHVLDGFEGEPSTSSTGCQCIKVKDMEKGENPVKAINLPPISAQSWNGEHYQILHLQSKKGISTVLKQSINTGRRSLEENEIPKTTDSYVCKQVLGVGDEDEAKLLSGFPKFEPLIVPSGWEQEEDMPKTTIPNLGPEGCKENDGDDLWKKNIVPSRKPAKKNEWGNGENSSWRLRKKEKYGGGRPSNEGARRNNGGRRNRSNNFGRIKWKQIWVPVKGKVVEN